MVTTRIKDDNTKSLPNVSPTAAPENPEIVPCTSHCSLLPETFSGSVNNDVDNELCSHSVDCIIPSSTSLSKEEKSLDIPTPMDTEDEINLTKETLVSETNLKCRENIENMEAGTESFKEMPEDMQNTKSNPRHSENTEDTLVEAVNAEISSSSKESGKSLVADLVITNLGIGESANNFPSASIPSPSVGADVTTPHVVNVTKTLECPSNAQEALTTQELSPDNRTNSNTTEVIQSSDSSSAPMTSSKTKHSSSSNTALLSIVAYGSSSDSEEEDEESESEASNVIQPVGDSLQMHIDTAGNQDVMIIPPPTKEGKEPSLIDLTSADYRNTIDICSGTDDSESDSECTSSSTSSSDDDSESSLSDIESSTIKKGSKETVSSETKKPLGKKKKTCLTKGEMSLEDLPPIEDLKISVSETLTQVIGFVFNVVEQQVVVQGHCGIPPIDLDSVLFLDNGKRALGRIFDVFGPVQEPLYVIRFNSADHIKENNVNKGDLVYYAPSTEHTSFVVIEELMRIKGSDASGLTGNEILPSEMTDFSDDEEEAKAKGKSKSNKYESSTGEFQSNKKRNSNRARGNEKRSNNRGQARGVGRGAGPVHNPFREHGQRPRPTHHQPAGNRPRFDPRGRPGPSRFREGPTSHRQGPPFKMNGGDFGPRHFSPYANQNRSNQRNNPWSQPPPAQFGGPPQFSHQAPPPTPPPPSYHAFSPDVQNNGPPVLSYPPPYSPRPHHPAGSFQNMAPPPSSSFQPIESPGPYHQTNGYQNMVPQVPHPSYPSHSPSPHYSPDSYMNMGPPVAPEMPPPDSSRNGGWLNPDSASHSPSSSHHSLSHPPPTSSHVMTSQPPPYSHPPPHSSMSHPNNLQQY